MIEKTIITHLNKVMGVKAYLEKPKDPAKSYLIVEKTSGGKANHICNAVVAIQSYAETMVKAIELNESVISAMEGLISKADVASCKLNTSYNFTNTTTKEYRYQAVFNIYYYEV